MIVVPGRCRRQRVAVCCRPGCGDGRPAPGRPQSRRSGRAHRAGDEVRGHDRGVHPAPGVARHREQARGVEALEALDGDVEQDEGDDQDHERDVTAGGHAGQVERHQDEDPAHARRRHRPAAVVPGPDALGGEGAGQPDEAEQPNRDHGAVVGRAPRGLERLGSPRRRAGSHARCGAGAAPLTVRDTRIPVRMPDAMNPTVRPCSSSAARSPARSPPSSPPSEGEEASAVTSGKVLLAGDGLEPGGFPQRWVEPPGGGECEKPDP